jgi:dihydropteroate synthase
MLQILEINNPKNLKEIMRELKVSSYGIKIMFPKAISYLVRINSISCIAANILKQEMLSLGGEVAVAQDALTGKASETDCLLMGNLSQINRLNDKLNRQPFGLAKLAGDLSQVLSNYQKDKFILDFGRYKLNLGLRAYIMGIVNLTPDSFSGDGLYQGLSPLEKRTVPKGTVSERVINFVQKLVKDGADIIDVGGESTRPGAKPVSLKEELARTIPIIKILARKIKVPISVDTYKPQVAREALDNGAVMVNDISGLGNPKMAKVVAKYKAGIVIMHMKRRPRSMQNNPTYKCLIAEIIEYLDKAINKAVCAGIDRDKIIIDPGIGFGKTLAHNLEILNRLKEFKVLGRPIMVGVSRKSFIGKILNAGPKERISGTISSSILAVKNGASIVRVHDVKEVKQALKISEAITYGARSAT